MDELRKSWRARLVQMRIERASKKRPRRWGAGLSQKDLGPPSGPRNSRWTNVFERKSVAAERTLAWRRAIKAKFRGSDGRSDRAGGAGAGHYRGRERGEAVRDGRGRS